MKKALNLLSEQFERKRVIGECLRTWCWILVLLATTAGLVCWRHWSACRALSARRASFERAYRPVRKLKIETAELTQEIVQLRRKEAIALELFEKRPILTLLGSVSRAVGKSDSQVYLKNLSLAAKSNRETNEAANVLVLSGIGTSNLAVARFAAALRDLELFDRVELKSTGAAQVGIDDARQFDLECRF